MSKQRLLAVGGMILALVSIAGAVNDFDNAHDWLVLIRALFWLVVSWLAFFAFLEDYQKNRWPL